jgi:sugar/nucleoside kinase (ribokinase family)
MSGTRSRVTPDVVCLGILVADVIARPVDSLPPSGSLGLLDSVSLHGGGCAINTATALTRLGLTAAVAGKVGSDTLGDFLVHLLDERGIERRGVISDPSATTSATVVLVAADGERTFLHAKGANAQLRVEELDAGLLFSGRCLHIAGALVLDDLDGAPCAAVLAEARRQGLLTSLDTVWDDTGRWERVLPCLPHVDVFAPSLAEARAISGKRDVAAVTEWLQQAGARDVVLKLGPRGCYVAGAGYVEPVQVDAVDGTGAGDAFAAGLLCGLLHGWPLARAARLANAAGALATTAVGAAEGLRDLRQTLARAGLE